MIDINEAKKKLKNLGYDSLYIWQDPPGTYYNWHTHNEDEVRFILDGSMIIGTEDKIYQLKAGDILEIPAGTKHWAKTEEGVRYLCGSKT